MVYLKKYVEFVKMNKNTILFVKLFVLIIINLWLIIIFWKILLIQDNLIINNNIVLTKASLALKPILNIFGLDILTPNMLNMFNNSTSNTNLTNSKIEIPTLSDNSIQHGFFKQLGVKVLEILDILIVKIKDKAKPYK